MIRAYFGTFRGLVRLALSHLQSLANRAGPRRPEVDVRRLVFVCQGNICRSAFAQAVAESTGLHTMSIGLSTNSGRPAHGPAIDTARELGFDLSQHRATALADYKAKAGDLLLAMEVRQLQTLAVSPHTADVPRILLGRWSWPFLHLHDPYKLDDAYMRHCLQRIERAVRRLKSRSHTHKQDSQIV